MRRRIILRCAMSAKRDGISDSAQCSTNSDLSQILPEHYVNSSAFTITRKGTQLRLRWKRVSAIRRYVLRLRLSDGRVLLLLPTPRQTAITVKGVGRKTTGTATLQAQDALGIGGTAARARLKR